ncbi:nucleotide-diphospho-sugar transferase, partial [Blyttiomyces helicus]
LTIVVPAYNESARLPTMMAEMFDYLKAREAREPSFTWEVIVVDDGSRDATADLARKLGGGVGAKGSGPKRGEVRVMVLEINRGKGGAVTQGMLAARGEKLLFADADGATQFSDVEKLERALEKAARAGLGVAVGSRAHMVTSAAVVKRSFIRNFLMHGFHTLLILLGIASIKDTQCGFKLLTRDAAIAIFPSMHCEGWIFDIEMLLIALKLRVPLIEVPVTWHEVDGTKMDLVRDSVRMLRDLILIRLNYLFGVW